MNQIHGLIKPEKKHILNRPIFVVFLMNFYFLKTFFWYLFLAHVRLSKKHTK